MIQKPTLVLLFTAAIIAAAVAFVRLRGSAPEPASAPTVAADQTAPADAPILPPALPNAAPAARAPQERAQFHEGDSEDLIETAEQRKDRTIRALQELDTKFQAEPVNPQWATPQEQMITASFSPEALKAKAAPTPLKHEESCRSNTCRISVTYKTPMDSQVGNFNLLAAISPSLTHAVFGEIPGGDGTVQMVVYASPGGPKPPPRH